MSIAACTETPVTPGVVVFDPVAFASAYPAFAKVPASALTANFQLATLMLDNSCCSVVKDAPTRELLLNLIVAHLTAILNGVNGQPPQGIVGRVNQATEGSVSVGTDMLAQSESASYWNQTPWGAMFWQLTLQYRALHYFPPHHETPFPWDAWPQ